MSVAAVLQRRLLASLDAFPVESRVLGLGRTILALAQLSVLVLTPASHLFVPVGADGDVLVCDSPAQQVSAYCLAGGLDRQVVTWVLAAGLVVVASGLLPRWTALPHWWISLSVGSSISLPDGGEAVVTVVTFFLVLALAGDARRWHWQRPTGRGRVEMLAGVSWAGAWGLRLQVAYVYLNSALAKLPVGPWQEGTATYYTSRMENFGAAGLLADLVHWSSAIPLVALATSWGAIVVESCIALTLLRRWPWPGVALVASVLLHVAIALEMGIVSFAVIMVGAVTCAVAPAAEPVLEARRRTTDATEPRDAVRPVAP